MSAPLTPDSSTAKWHIATPNQAVVDTLVRDLNVSPITATLLVNRGITTAEAAHAFLHPDIANLSDPYRFPDMQEAVDRLAFAVENNERIFVHGDYDVDGVTSAALCVRALQGLGADVIGYVPRRSDGYDLQKVGVDKAIEAGAKMIFTADCGIKAVEPVAYANAKGLDVVVTDHHRPGKELPAARAVVNPYRDDAAAIEKTSQLGFYDYVGVAVAYKTLDALTERLRPTARNAFRQTFLDLVALGTVQDMAPVLGENRLFVTHGLTALSQSKKKGIQALLTHFGLANEPLLAEHIGFKLGPLLNSAGRMEDADKAYRLLITKDPLEAEQIAVDLQGLNQLRKEEQAKIVHLASALALLPENVDQRVLVLADTHWKSGLAGLAAGNLVSLFNRPVVLLSYNKERDEYHGSARGWGDFHMLNALKECDAEGMLGRYGGHSSAAGVTVLGPYLEAFKEKLHTLAEGIVDTSDLQPTLDIDAEIPDGRALTFELLDEMEKLEPWGRGNEEPTFATRGAKVLEIKRVGKDQNTLNMQLQLPGMFGATKAVWFKNGAKADEIMPGSRVDIAYRPKFNHWNGKTTLDLMLKDVHPSE